MPRRHPAGAEAGHLVLILHAHLPYVRHPRHPHFLEETWLFEAVAECYLPLLDVLERLAEEEVPYRITLSVSPTLGAMLTDPVLQRRFMQHMDALIRLAEREASRRDACPRWRALARFYAAFFAARRRQFDDLPGRDVTAAFRRLADAGHVELMASAATHAYLPLLAAHPEAVRGQIALGLETHRRLFGRPARGFWLPECGFDPALAAILAEAGVRWTVLDTHGVLHARPRPAAGSFAPVACADTGLLAFGRDPAASAQVWSARQGYPGHPAYREFYRDIGMEQDLGPLAPWIPPGSRAFTGLKFYRVTGPGRAKDLYDPAAARRQARRHAVHFVLSRARAVRRLAAAMDRPPLIVAPYDAELFGHWWFEGPIWLETVLRLTAGPPRRRPTSRAGAGALPRPAFPNGTLPIGLTTPEGYARTMGKPASSVRLSLSSWGEQGYSHVWINGKNYWIAMELDRAIRAMKQLARAFPHPTPLQRRALNHAAKELLLAQSSDWPFLIHAGTAADYAARRVRHHLHRFHTLARQLAQGAVDPFRLASWEGEYPIFPDMDYRLFSSRLPAAGSAQGKERLA